MHKIAKLLLWPFSLLYGSITRVRNLLYDRDFKKSFQPPVTTVSVGNLTVGGTGKTPCVEYLIRLLAGSYHITVLSRGYGRGTKGYIAAEKGVSANIIGDEPLQYFLKYGEKVNVAVCEDRVEGFQRLYKQFPQTGLLLLDDAYQHRAIQPHVNILLNDYHRPFYHDLPFPAGRLREGRTGAGRADAVIVTKCPVVLTSEDQKGIETHIRSYTRPGVPVFFAGIAYGKPVNFAGQTTAAFNSIVAVAGIAQPGSFLKYLNTFYSIEKTLLYKDHHDYVKEDLEEMIKYLKKDNFVVTTEKDRVKLAPLLEGTPWQNRFLYIPIQMEFKGNAGSFDEWIKKRIVRDNEQQSFDA